MREFRVARMFDQAFFHRWWVARARSSLQRAHHLVAAGPTAQADEAEDLETEHKGRQPWNEGCRPFPSQPSPSATGCSKWSESTP